MQRHEPPSVRDMEGRKTFFPEVLPAGTHPAAGCVRGSGLPMAFCRTEVTAGWELVVSITAFLPFVFLLSNNVTDKGKGGNPSLLLSLCESVRHVYHHRHLRKTAPV